MRGTDRAAHFNKIEEYLLQEKKLVFHEGGSLNHVLNDCISVLDAVKSNRMDLSAFKEKLKQVRVKITQAPITKKIEVVFFPYKVAMSDSMQTIYLAAKSDPSCDAYWCPIPYFDRNKDLSLGEMYYEGGGYSEEFEITNWEEYDAEVRHPDIVFTHYAYDEYNYVTTIHPAFYSSKLKNFTNLLVYIDYGITMRVARRIGINQKLLENEQFISAYWNADLIVAYSREFAKVVEFHMKSFGKLDDDQTRIVASKIVPLGSAKIDTVLRAKRENFVLPGQWMDKIGGRKVLLYNTSLHGLLKESDVFLKEIFEVIEATLKNDDVVLWWRPHPLMENTLHTMRPELAQGIHEIIGTFKEQEWGIFDETDDLYRAIAWSDACLTNESSLAWLYLASGKPFTILDANWLLKSPKMDDGEDFSAPLQCRINNMKAGNGANPQPEKWNVCVWWQNFSTEDILHNIHYNNFLDRFMHFVVHREEYLEADEYQRLQLQIVHDFVVNSDGTAGAKIYDYCRQRVILKMGKF